MTGPSEDCLRQGETADFIQPLLEQILGRSLIGGPQDEHREVLSACRILVTGAGGSIGTALSRWLALIAPKSLVLVDNHENSLFRLMQELAQPNVPLRPEFVLADVRNSQRIGQLVRESRPDIVFHLAAYKHVPIAELWPAEFVQTNLIATFDLALAAASTGVRKIVYTSTDKAVNPPSIYGATKRAAEIALQAVDQMLETRITIVRLVNVLGARGGVIEAFARNAAAGQPLRITDPKMSRYWITLPEALHLLAAAACHPSSGILLPDAGPPLNIVEMAKAVWRAIRGTEDGFQAEFTGVRPGERLSEELVYPYESLRSSRTQGVLEVAYNSGITSPSLDEVAERLSLLKRLADAGDSTELRKQLFTFISACNQAGPP